MFGVMKAGCGLPTAQPTELSVGAAFGHTAVLAHRPENQSLLTETGRLYGRLVFLIDSYQDYTTDLI